MVAGPVEAHPGGLVPVPRPPRGQPGHAPAVQVRLAGRHVRVHLGGEELGLTPVQVVNIDHAGSLGPWYKLLPFLVVTLELLIIDEVKS